MKKIIVAGNIGSGKTTLCQYLNNEKIEYKKTQSVEVINTMIDTPGEYFQHRNYLRGLISYATDTEIMIFVLDPTSEQIYYRYGLASSFYMEVIGVITKTDIATKEEIENGREILTMAGVSRIFEVSAITGDGMQELMEYLSND